ncbi:MAG TPA: DUF2298 domain-containing protein [Candidatus Dormibacteraeota bacterium]|nr:DUF2298 domain-containing protein [Candidatus Dormibacteraeota bacterium]
MSELLRAYVIVSLCGWAVFPMVRRLLAPLPDRGYAVGRCFGLVLIAWVAWILAWMSGRALTTPLALGSLVLVAAAGWIPSLLKRRRQGIGGALAELSAPGLPRRLPAFIACTEALFLLGMLLFVLLEERNPAVDPDSERFMDYAFLRACLRSPGLPLMDPWFAGGQAAYYHFGYALVAFLVRACGADPARMLGSAIALPYALLWTGAFAIGVTLTGRARGGIWAAFLALGAGNLEWLRQGLRALRPAAFDWFASSRAIDGTITEFPWFSLLWGDPHPYVMAMPILVTALAFVLAVTLNAPAHADAGRGAENRFIPAGRIAALALLGGAVLAAHPWDYPLLFGSALLIAACAGGRHRTARIGSILLAAALAWPLFIPFLKGLALGGHGLGRVAVRSAPGEWFMAYGPFVLLLCLGGPLLLRTVRDRPGPGEDDRAAHRAAVAFGACALLTALFCEVAYVRDLFAPTPLARMNTVFKLYRFSWLLLALASSLWIESLLGPVRSRLDVRRWAGRAVVALVVGAALVYPVYGTAAWLRVRRNEAARQEGAARAALLPGADAEALFRARLPGDADAAAFLARSAGGAEALVEETGEPYTWSSRISTFSGVPSVLGWGNHEAIWRGGWDEIQKRTADIVLVYTRPGSQEACDRLRRYGARWIVAGGLERLRYGPSVDDFGRLARPVFASKGTAVYSVDDVCARATR